MLSLLERRQSSRLAFFEGALALGQKYRSIHSARVYEVDEIDTANETVWLVEIEQGVRADRRWSCAFTTLSHPDLYEEVIDGTTT